MLRVYRRSSFHLSSISLCRSKCAFPVQQFFCSSMPSSGTTAASASGTYSSEPLKLRHERPLPGQFYFFVPLGPVSPSWWSSLASSQVPNIMDASRHYAQCYWELSKARLSMLVVATSGTGFVLASDHSIDIVGLCSVCTGTMMVAASANTLNQVFEISNDSKMKRTRHRPLPSGRITVPYAISWASATALMGTTLLAVKGNVLSACLAVSNLVLYSFVYTPLKQMHPVNTWVGAVVGAIPPLLGWVAASGEISFQSMILPAALYFWQIPHFMALAYLLRDDYVSGGFRMFSLSDYSGRRTALAALRNCLYLFPLGFLSCYAGLTSNWFCAESSLLSLAISGTAFAFYRNRTAETARRMFRTSLVYLPVFMSGLLIHRLSGTKEQHVEQNAAAKIRVVADGEVKKREAWRERHGTRALWPPVAYASVAPFPFLPAPCV